MLGDISPQTVRITQQAVVYPSRNHVVSLRVERFDGRTYKPVDMTAVTRVILSFPEADPVIVYDSSVQAMFTHVGTTLTVDLSDYAMPASVLGCQIVLYDAEHPAGQVLVDDIDAVVQFDFRNVHMTGGTPPPAVEYITDAPIDGVTYARKDGLWVPVDALVSGVSSVNGQSGVVVLDAADVGADAAGTGASQAASAVAAHVALSDPHPQYLTPAEGNTAYDAIGAAASAVSTHVAASDPHPQYLTPTEGNAAYDALGAAESAVSTHVAASDPHPQYLTPTEGNARYERNLTAGANITIDRTNPAAPVISASGGGGGGGAVDSVNGQTGVVVLDTDDIAEGVSNLYFTNGRVAAAAPVQTVDGQAGAVSLSSSYAPLSHVGAGGAAHSNAVAAGAAGFMTGADKTKLNGIATGATQNSSDAFLRARGNHTGTQTASTISDFTEAAQDVVGTSVVAGANVTVTYDDGTGLTTVAASSGAALPVVRAITANETLALANINTFGVNSAASNYTSTIPAQATVAWTADAELHFLPSNTGDVTITAAAGVSLNGVVAGSLTLSTQNGAASLKRIGADSWWLGGVIGTAAEQRDALGLGSADSPSFAGLSITGGPLALTGSGRRINGDFSSGLGSFGNRTIFQSSTVNGQTILTVIPNGTSVVAGFQVYANAADQENSTRAAVNLLGGSGLFITSDRTGSGAYVPVVLSTGGADRLTISTAGTITAPGVYASTTASAANVFVDATGLLQRSTSSEQYKRDIEPMSADYADRAYLLQPIWYHSKCENDSQDWSWWGFSAEQAAKVDPRLVHWRTTEPVEVDGPVDEETGIARKVIEHRPLSTPVAEGFAYERLTVHHNALLTAQRDRIASLEEALEKLAGKVAAIEALL